ncbi:MAG: hypothetical protein RJA25_1949 [Bacteroidota bacterium]|jgi:hypothetical protein
MKKNIFPFVLIFLLLNACHSTTENHTENTVEETPTINYLALGDSIAVLAQQTLLSNVQEAMKNGGPSYAVGFCHSNADKIMDKLSSGMNVKIQRVALKNRNENNAPGDESEQKLLEYYDTQSKTGNPIKDTVFTIAKGALYFKPIKMAMPTCLKCHGKPGVDIDNKTLALLKEKYPNDKATGYSLNDFRGAWKITFSK